MKKLLYLIVLQLFLTPTFSFAQCTVLLIPGSGTNSWNVLVYNAGDQNGGSNAWNNSFFKGYYNELQLSFDTRIGQTNSTS